MMELDVVSVDDRPEWKALSVHAEEQRDFSLHDAFAHEPRRAEQLCAEGAGVYLDYSKDLVTTETRSLLVALAEACGLRQRIDAMFSGEHINVSEHRAALHVALRAEGRQIIVDGNDVVGIVQRELANMREFAAEVRDGRWLGGTGRPIRNVVNIGIGGSDLGPAMAYTALRAYADPDRHFRFVSNIDEADLLEAIRDLDPAETLFVVCSKSWHTQETLVNATAARDWLLAALAGDRNAVAKHFVAVSTNLEAVRAFTFGSDQGKTFALWDWVGGRYSLDSAVGLSLMIALGPDGFDEMLSGFRQMDDHFERAPFSENLPVLMGLLSVWHNNFLGAQTYAVLPYSAYLEKLPAYLQQLEMESNGKRVDLAGRPLSVQSGPIVWGQPGTNGQHAFYQLLHQGTKLVPCEFIGFIDPVERLGDQHDLLMANLFAQSQALAFGRDAHDLAAAGVDPAEIPHRVCPGNRPSVTLLFDRLTPENFGKLIALYEHRVFVEGVIWGIDSFDQWGVELGKILAASIEPVLASGELGEGVLDASTASLVARYLARRGRA